jgi:hypothetical protein
MIDKVISFFEKQKDIFFISILILFSVIVHIYWFHPWSTLADGDWASWNTETVEEVLYSWGTWTGYNNFGDVNIQIPFNLFTSLWWFFVHIGLSFNQAAKITFFIPIALLSFIAPYLLAKKLSAQSQVAFITSLFYGTTTYGIANQPPIQFVYAIFPIIFFLFIRAFEKRTFSSWIIFGLIYALAVCYEVRIMYIVTVVLFLYFLFFHLRDLGSLAKHFLAIGVILILLESFWLLPAVLGGTSHEIAVIANRGLFGNGLFNLQRAFTLSTWDWTGGLRDISFTPQPIAWQFWVLPIFLFSSLLLLRKRALGGKTVFFLIILLLGLLLTKQSGNPFPDLYQWLYGNFPGFNLFREASKFYILVAFGYFGALVCFLNILKKEYPNKKLFYSVFFALAIIFVWNAKPYITQEARTLFVSREMPSDYPILKEFILGQDNYFRSFFVPRSSNWAINTNNHPKISQVETLVSWIDASKKFPTDQAIIDMIDRDYSDNLLDIFSVGYVIVPIRDTANDDDFFQYYGNREFFIQELDKLSYLKRIDIGTQDLVVYENENYRPHIYTTYEKETIYKEVSFGKVDFQFKNPTEYSMNLKNVSAPVYVNFSEKYHSDWKLRAGNFQWFDVLRHKDYFLSDVNHFENDAKLNSFLIDPKEVCGTAGVRIKPRMTGENDKSGCMKNLDGSYNINLTLYFKPQSYFYLGLIISGTTLIGCLGYLVYAWWVGRKVKKSLI